RLRRRPGRGGGRAGAADGAAHGDRAEQDRPSRRRRHGEMVRERLAEREVPVLEVSAVSHKGLRDLSFVLGGLVEAARAEMPEPETAPIVLTPAAVDA